MQPGELKFLWWIEDEPGGGDPFFTKGGCSPPSPLASSTTDDIFTTHNNYYGTTVEPLYKGKEILASIKKCPYLGGRFVLWDITMWSEFLFIRGGC